MTRPLPPSRRARRGSVSLELAAVLTVLMVVLPALVLFGRAFYQYMVIKSACDSAALYLASMPPAEFRDELGHTGAMKVARRIVADAIAEGGASASVAAEVIVKCDGSSCLRTAPPKIYTVETSVSFSDLGLQVYPDAWTNDERHWVVKADATVPNLTN